ncbi:MAG: sulfatase, partial [Phycisphaeraceae bacterium]|nr:sulfatase [Phycisphaeraceae bacterium]
KYNNAYSTSSFTPPAHASLFTSRYVGNHGLITWNRLPEDQLTLAEVMSGHGYVSAARVNLQMLSQQGLYQGFKYQREHTSVEEYVVDGRLIVDDALDLLNMDMAGPFIMWLHFYDVHSPYGRQTEWTKRFVETTRPGIGDTIKHYRLTPTETSYGHNLEESGLTEADLDYIAARYDGGVAYVDFTLKRLFQALNTPQHLSDTMVVVTSDHGENLLERESCRFAHDPFLQSTVTRVPLLIRYPGLPGAGQSSDALVSLIDVAPTVLDVAGLPAPPTFTGTSLVPLLAGESHWSRQELYMECWGNYERKAVRSDRHLIIHDVKTNMTQLYDLAADPREMHPLTDTQDPDMVELYKKLVRFNQREVSKVAAEGFDPETT